MKSAIVTARGRCGTEQKLWRHVAPEHTTNLFPLGSAWCRLVCGFADLRRHPTIDPKGVIVLYDMCLYGHALRGPRPSVPPLAPSWSRMPSPQALSKPKTCNNHKDGRIGAGNLVKVVVSWTSMSQDCIKKLQLPQGWRRLETQSTWQLMCLKLSETRCLKDA